MRHARAVAARGVVGARGGVCPQATGARSGGALADCMRSPGATWRAGRWGCRTGRCSTTRTSSTPSPSRRTARAWRTRTWGRSSTSSRCGRWAARRPALVADKNINPYEFDMEAVGFSPDGGLVATAGRDGAVRLFDAATNEPKGLVLAEEPLTAVAFHPSGRYVVVGSAEGLISVFTVPQLSFVYEVRAHMAPVSALAFAADGHAVQRQLGQARARLGRLARSSCARIRPASSSTGAGASAWCAAASTARRRPPSRWTRAPRPSSSTPRRPPRRASTWPS